MNTQKLTDDELRFLTQIRRYATNLNDSDRKLLCHGPGLDLSAV